MCLQNFPDSARAQLNPMLEWRWACGLLIAQREQVAGWGGCLMFLKTVQQAKRFIKIVTGFTLLLAGLIMLVTPGPGWLTIALGLAVLIGSSGVSLAQPMEKRRKRPGTTLNVCSCPCYYILSPGSPGLSGSAAITTSDSCSTVQSGQAVTCYDASGKGHPGNTETLPCQFKGTVTIPRQDAPPTTGVAPGPPPPAAKQ